MTAEDPAATTAVVSDPAVRGSTQGPPTLAIFGGLFTLLVLSIGASALLLAGVGRTTSNEPAPTAIASAATRGTAAPAAVTASDRVRVLTASGRSTPTEEGMYRVTFTWSLEGARESDSAVIRVYAGNQLLGEQRGALEPAVFSFSTGMLTITTMLECSTSGWSADLVSIRGVLVEGDGIALVPGVACD